MSSFQELFTLRRVPPGPKIVKSNLGHTSNHQQKRYRNRLVLMLRQQLQTHPKKQHGFCYYDIMGYVSWVPLLPGYFGMFPSMTETTKNSRITPMPPPKHSKQQQLSLKGGGQLTLAAFFRTKKETSIKCTHDNNPKFLVLL